MRMRLKNIRRGDGRNREENMRIGAHKSHNKDASKGFHIMLVISHLTCLILSLVTRKCFPISSNVIGLPSARPNLISMICDSLDDRSSMVRLSSLLTLVLSFTLEGWAAWDTSRSLTYICIALCGVVEIVKIEMVKCICLEYMSCGCSR